MPIFMRLILLVLLLFQGHAVTAAQSPPVQQPHLEARLLSEYQTLQPGQRFSMAVQLQPDEGWHTYWINPGDSGLATSIRWNLPEGLEAAGIQWPVPQLLRVGHLANYGFEGSTHLLTDLILGDDVGPGSIEISAQVDWLVCKEICIPGSALLELELNVADRAEPARSNQPYFEQARLAQPLPRDWPVSFELTEGLVSFKIHHPDASSMAYGEVHLFVGASELVEHARPQEIIPTGDALIIRQPRNTYFSQVDDGFPVVLVHDAGAILLTAAAADPGPAAPPQTAISGGIPVAGIGMTSALLMALLGGLILNLMPCVFPVLSLKAIHLAKRSERRLSDALAYTAGVLLSFLFIAGLLLVLRATGEALGWGFQLQNPWLIGALSFLFVAIGLNLSGTYEVATGLMGLGQGRSGQRGIRASLMMGVLAVTIASPCTAPFMGVALGFAITQPTAMALMIFAALGLGFAAPLLLLAMMPGLSRVLPAPGPWMNTFKQWMAVPMYLTTVWLLWVFGRQQGVDSLGLLMAALVLFIAGLWWWGVCQMQHRPGRQKIISLLLLGLSLITALAAVKTTPAIGERATADAISTRNWQPWSPELQASLLQQQLPVFVNMTADWCITCLANERVALETAGTRELFERHDIHYLKGDWTLRDPQITRYLESHGRSGVPLYVLYWPGREAKVLPQILTPAIVRDSIDFAMAQGQ